MKAYHWINTLDQNTKDFVTAFQELSNEEMNWKPDAQTWSIGQNIHHLMVINSTYFPILESLHAGTYRTPFIGKINFLVNYFGNFIFQSVQPEQAKKIKTFSIWEPTYSDVPADILDQFTVHQDTLKTHIEKAHHLLQEDVVISSPANQYIVYRLSKAFDIIVTHEQRHFLQAKAVLEVQQDS